jgi:hypothetical protein
MLGRALEGRGQRLGQVGEFPHPDREAPLVGSCASWVSGGAPVAPPGACRCVGRPRRRLVRPGSAAPRPGAGQGAVDVMAPFCAEGGDCSNAAGFPGLTLMQPLPRNEPKVHPGANQGSPQEIKVVPTRECREDVADHPGRQATVSEGVLIKWCIRQEAERTVRRKPSILRDLRSPSRQHSWRMHHLADRIGIWQCGLFSFFSRKRRPWPLNHEGSLILL